MKKIYIHAYGQREDHMGGTLEMVFLLLLNIVVNIIIGKFFRCKDHQAGDARYRGW